MKKATFIILSLIVITFVGCGSDKNKDETRQINNVISDYQKSNNEEYEMELDNDTPMKACRLLLKSLCTDDYELFLVISRKADTYERQDKFKSLQKGYKGKDYKTVSIESGKYGDNILVIEDYFEDTGEKMPSSMSNKLVFKKYDEGYYYNQYIP